MKKTIIFTALMLVALGANAKERTQSELKTIAARALKANTAATRASLEKIENSLRDIATLDEVAVFSADELGSVFVTRDDAFEEVLGVSDTPIDMNNVPANFRWWLETTNDVLKARRAKGLALTRAAVNEAENVVKKEPTNVPNFLRAKWSQEFPYNAYCPEVGGANTLTGCVATAMAQIFHYYKYPESLNGETGYSYVVSNGTYLTPVTSKLWLPTAYDWSGMSNTYNGTSEAPAVAELMRDCGYAAHLEFGLDATGGLQYDVPFAVGENFRYNKKVIGRITRTLYTEDEWNSMLYSELAQHNPIFYGGTTPAGEGHAFVFCGMQTDGKVYVNWGWSGSLNGFYTIKYLCPEEGMNFSYRNVQATLGFRPVEAEDGEKRTLFAKSMFSLLHTYSVVDENGDETVYTKVPTIYLNDNNELMFASSVLNNEGHWPTEGDIYWQLRSVSNPEVCDSINILHGTFKAYQDEVDYKLARKDTININSIVKGKPAGAYRLALLSKAVDEDTPSYVRSIGGIWMAEIIMGDNGQALSVTVLDPTVASQPSHAVIPSYITEMWGHYTEYADKLGTNDNGEVRDMYDAIDDITAETLSPIAPTYDMVGRRINEVTRGLVIRNGRKYINK